MARHRVQVLRAAGNAGGGGVVRRLIFLRIGSPEPAPARSAIFLLDVRPLGPGTGWERVPTPMF